MKKFSNIIIMSIALLLAMDNHSFSQGCVAIRCAEEASSMQPSESSDYSGWLLNINNRYFKSIKHFVVTEEHYKRVENGTELINHTYNTDLFQALNINRAQSVPDKIRIEKTGAYEQVDAAFADYAVNNW